MQDLWTAVSILEMEANHRFSILLRKSSGFGRVRVLLKEFAGDVYSLWRYGAPFPTFLKVIGTLVLCLLVILPIIYPVFLAYMTYFTFEGLFLSWWHDQPWRFLPAQIARRALAAGARPVAAHDMLKVREVVARAILLAHSLATSVDYMCVMQGLLEDV